nr:MFS transporter [Candidatus Sigynarchaeota archaeon]
MSDIVDERKARALRRADFFGVFLIFPLVLLASSDGAILAGNQVLILADLNATILMFGLLVGLGILSSGIFTFVFGYMSDKRSRKQLLLVGGAIWATTSILISFAPTIETMLVLRLCSTMGLGAISPVVFSLLSDMFPSEKRSNSFAWWGIATLIGGLGGGAIALAFNVIPFESIPNWELLDLPAKMVYLQANYPSEIALWRMPFLLVGVLGLIFCGLLMFVKEPKRGARDKQLRDALAKDELQYAYKIKRSDLKYIFTRRSNFWLIFNFLDVVVSGFFIANILLYIEVEMQFSFTSMESIGQILLLVLPALVLGLFGQFHYAKV